jgi:hypothetical protein
MFKKNVIEEKKFVEKNKKVEEKIKNKKSSLYYAKKIILSLRDCNPKTI